MSHGAFFSFLFIYLSGQKQGNKKSATKPVQGFFADFSERR
jgi:hypothetical protein